LKGLRGKVADYVQTAVKAAALPGDDYSVYLPRKPFKSSPKPRWTVVFRGERLSQHRTRDAAVRAAWKHAGLDARTASRGGWGKLPALMLKERARTARGLAAVATRPKLEQLVAEVRELLR
jgi:hypothetical protein